MGLPLWKPRDLVEDASPILHKSHRTDIADRDDNPWPNFSRQLMQHVHRRNSSPLHRNSQPRAQTRIGSRNSILTSSLVDRRRSSRAHLPGSSTSTSPPIRSELDRRLHQRITEKEDLLEQLSMTATLLDHFLAARSAYGSDAAILSSVLIEEFELPAILENAYSLIALTPSVLSITNSSNTTSSSRNGNREPNTLQEMVDRLLQIPPYSNRIQSIEQNIISAHRRIQDQLDLLGSAIPSRPHNSSSQLALTHTRSRVTSHTIESLPLSSDDWSHSRIRDEWNHNRMHGD
ncbi:hypothetical protein A0J61_03411 [Choanephora cucurbitarum]|uniref:Uncharacterized protein n=1 Tax=Choanephora cucurbitarum TaxID=101091 RepID=A0A1C7NHS0_9FUNG|nr:hypothetical protein A0J61_03411 [Choanephora cucurbitarum]